MSGSAAVRVRKAGLADKEFVLETAGRLGDVPLPGWRKPDQIVGAESRALLAAFDDPGLLRNLFIAEAPGGDPHGFLYLEHRSDYFTQAPHGHVSMLAVASGAEGRGVATALMQAAEDWARANGHPHLTLNVFGLNARARALYERLGYEPDTVKYLKPLRPS